MSRTIVIPRALSRVRVIPRLAARVRVFLTAISAPPPVEPFGIITEASDLILTESTDVLRTES